MDSVSPVNVPPKFLTGGGEMGALLRAHDWSASALGMPEDWPFSLRTAVGIMLNTNHPAYIFWGEDGACLYNDAYMQSIGPERHPGSLGQPAKEVWAEIWDVIGPQIEQVMAGRGATWYENQLVPITRNGRREEVYWTYSYSPIGENSAPNGVGGVLVICSETTRHVLAERQLTEQTARLLKLFDGAPSWMAVLRGPDHRFEFANDTYIKFVGGRDLIGKTALEAVPEAEEQGLIAMLDSVYSSGKRHAAEQLSVLLQRSPRQPMEEVFVDFVCEPVRNETGEVSGIFIQGIDVTNRVHARSALQESEERFRLIADSAPVPMWVTQQDRTRSFVNRAYLEFVGTSYEDALLFDWRMILHPDDHDRIVADSIAGEASLQPFVLEGRYRRADGEWRWLQSTSQPRFDADGSHAGFIGVAHDISEAKEAEASLRASERRFRFLDRLAEATQTEADPEAVMAASTRLLGEHLDVDICAYADVEADGDTFHIRRDWTRSGVPSIVGDYSLGKFGPVAAAAQHNGTALVVNDVFAELGHDQIFTSIGISATICLPLVKHGRLAAMMAVHNATPRVWLADEVSLVHDVAERCWAHVERVGADAILRESEQRFREQFENANDFIFTTDLEMRITSCNPAVASALDLTQQQLTGHLISEFTPPETWERNKAMLAAKLAGKGDSSRYEVEVFDKKGSRMMWEINSRLIRDSTGAPSGLHAIGRDITEQIRSQRLLDQARIRAETESAKQAAILGQLAEGVIIADASGRITFVNEAATKLHGVATLDVAPSDYSATYRLLREDGTPYPSEELPLARAVLKGETVRDARWRIQRPDGTEVVAIGNAQPVLGAQGTQIGAVLTVRDDTARHAAELALRDVNETLEERVAMRNAELEHAHEALRQSQKLEAMGQLTGGVAHDFNNLLTPILGSLDLLQRKGVGDERQQRLIDGALQSAERARLLVQRLLAFARRQPLQTVAVDIGELITGMADLVGSTCGPGIKISLSVAEDLPLALADPNQLEMAILNLSVNARDAMPDGGLLTLAAVGETVDAGDSTKLAPGKYVRLSIADSGIGMDEETVRRAVEPFFSTKAIGQGTGLGLSMAHGLASQLGGALTLSSLPGLGTNVELWIPASEVQHLPQSVADTHAGHATATGTILLVDDEQLVRHSTADMLIELGYEVVEAASASEALKIFAGEKAFDMLVTDHLMPGMNGADLAAEIQRLHPGLPVLIVSGYADAGGIPEYLPRLTKPFRQADLLSALDEIVNAALVK